MVTADAPQAYKLHVERKSCIDWQYLIFMLDSSCDIVHSRLLTASVGAGGNRSTPPGAMRLLQETEVSRWCQWEPCRFHGSQEGPMLLPWEAGPLSPLQACARLQRLRVSPPPPTPTPPSVSVSAPAPGGRPELGCGGSPAPYLRLHLCSGPHLCVQPPPV